MQKVGVIGLGNMGLAMATTLARAGFAVTGFDVSPARLDLASGQGIAPLPLADLLRGAEAIVCSLPRGRDVEASLTLPGALLDRRDRRVIVLDTSTAEPETSRRLAARLGAAGHGHLDAPVSGGPSGAASGALTMMLGGTDADVAAAAPLTAALSARAMHVGPSGAGNVAKLVNNMLVAAHMITTGEAMRLAEAAGVPAAALLPVINAATGRSAISEIHAPTRILSGSFDSGFSAGLMRKDVELALAMARGLGLTLPLSEAAGHLWLDDRDGVPDTADFTLMAGYRPEKVR